MLRKFYGLVVFVFFLASVCCAQTSEAEPLFLLTQPKAGTNLLSKLVKMMTGRQAHRVVNISDGSSSPAMIDEFIAQGGLAICHFYGPKEIYRYFLKNHLQAKIVCIIRDPRDAYVSLGFHRWDEHPDRSVEERVSLAFQDGGYLRVIQNLPLFLDHPRFFIVRFEDLIGPQGGGSFERQKMTIRAIAKYIGLKFSDQEIEQFGLRLFGNQEGTPRSWTYREGQIGSWKQCLSAEQIRFCKKHFGKTLIRLGYEKDLNW